ncbi:MAG: hypothetical protein NVSMB1_00460 [Polyangiales bacterium]
MGRATVARAVTFAERWRCDDIFIGGLFFLAGCGGTLTIVVRAAVLSRCESAGLKGCDKLSDGVILYAAGDKEKGQEKLRAGIGANTPDEVRSFALTLKKVITLPGIDSYGAPIREVVDFLAIEVNKTPTDQVASGDEGASRKGSVTLETESALAKYRTLTVVPAAHHGAIPCTPFSATSIGAPARCARVSIGPLIVTDVHVGGGCADELFLLVEKLDEGNASRPRWYLIFPSGGRFEIHGAALTVKADERIVVGFTLPAEGAPMKDPHCSITWASRDP